MKFGKITAENVSHNALSLGGALAGGALSGGIMTLVPEKQALLAKGGMAVVGLVGAASIKAKSSAENLVKFILLGVAIRQGSELITHVVKDQITVDPASTSSKFVGGMVGLACPCDYPALGSPVISFPALMNPYEGQEVVEEYAAEELPAGAFF